VTEHHRRGQLQPLDQFRNVVGQLLHGDRRHRWTPRSAIATLVEEHDVKALDQRGERGAIQRVVETEPTMYH